jgi:hypothetical protein
MKNIATALVKAQKAFGPALKQSINPAFHKGGKGGRYADLSACVEAVIDALNDNGIFFNQHTYEHNEGIVIETVFTHESGEQMNCGRLFFPANKQDPQGFMSCLTYIRRASLMAATGQAPEDDDGNAAVKQLPIQSHVDPISLGLLIDKMREAENEVQLKASFRIAYQACHNEKQWQEMVNKVKDELRSLLNERNSVPSLPIG